MIELCNVVKRYPSRHGMSTVLNGVDLRIRRHEKIGILGRNGAGKSTLIRLIGGAELPTSGSVERGMSVSWPLAFGGAFQGALTGFDNYRFICRVYGTNPADKVDYIKEFTELGSYLYEPIRTYSAGMRARLAFAISMAIDFDCFLIDEIIAVGDHRFHLKCHEELFVKRSASSLVIVSHDPTYMRDHCSRFAVLSKGKLSEFADADMAYEFYNQQASAFS